MNFVNLRISTLRSPEYLGCEPVARATWLSLLAYCHEQENGGVIEGATKWGDRQWQQIAGVTRAEVCSASPLITLCGDDVAVWGFDLEKQAEVQARREQARDAARRRWDTKLGARPARCVPARKRGVTSVADAPRIPLRNAEEEREGEGEMLCVVHEKPDHIGTISIRSVPSTTTPRFISRGTPSNDHNETDTLWLSRLRREWPDVDVEQELGRAAVYVRKARGPDAQLQRRFFEQEWLPRSAEPVATDRTQFTSKTKEAIEPEPDGWKTYLDRECAGSVYATGGSIETNDWRKLPRAARQFLIKRMLASSGVLSNVEVVRLGGGRNG